LHKIHIIGDSHALTFIDADNVITHWIGAATAHNLSNKYETVKHFFSGFSDDYWFCLGEIDCRLHIYRQHKITGRTQFSLIQYTVENYLEAVNVFDGWNLGVMAVPPQGYQDNFFEYDYYASREHRQQITDVFNFCLENRCLELEIPFIDIWKQESLWPEENFKEDKCHIKNEIATKFLEEYLDNN
jgi:hypothetical protein